MKVDQIYSDDSDEDSLSDYAGDFKRPRVFTEESDSNAMDYEESVSNTPQPGGGGENVLQKLANLRERKATELLSSLACPASVQAQITAAQPNAIQGLTEAKLKRVSHFQY